MAKGDVKYNEQLKEFYLQDTNRWKALKDLDIKFKTPNGYISPKSYGAKMDGVTDDRDAFVATLAAAKTLDKRVWIDSDIFLDVEEVGTKSIFLDSNIWIEGAQKSSIIVNSLMSPAFYATFEKNIMFKNIKFLYDNEYDATFRYDGTTNNANYTQLKDHLAANKNLTFTTRNPILQYRSPVNFRYMMVFAGAEDVTFDNVVFESKGETAEKFMIGAIKMTEEYAPNQVVTDISDPTRICRNFTLNNVVMDKVVMGIQGIVDGFKSKGLRSLRYTDVQSPDGSNIGGVHPGYDAYWMPPPHLIYINNDGATTFRSQNVEIEDTIDFGIYVGDPGVRGVLGDNSGYCPSLKLVNEIDDIKVRGYYSYRRDGGFDMGSLSNSVIEDFYVEYTSHIFRTDSKFCGVRFLEGGTQHTIIKNMVVKDMSPEAHYYPITYGYANNTTWDGMHLYVNEFPTTQPGSFGLFGSNNTIINSTLNIQNHTSTQVYRGPILMDDNTRLTGANNHFEVEVRGWRNIEGDNSIDYLVRSLFQNSLNPNSNYARCYDVDNNFIMENSNGVVKNMWTKSEIVSLGIGTNQALSINLPKRFGVKKMWVEVLTTLGSGTFSLGTSVSNKNDLVPTFSNVVGVTAVSLSKLQAEFGNRSIYIHSTEDFGSTGSVKVTLELERTTNENNVVTTEINASEETKHKFAHYIDTVRISDATALAVTKDVASILLPNNAGTVVNTYAGGNIFYDGTDILAIAEGVRYAVSVRMTVESDNNDGGVGLELVINGGATIISDSRRLLHAANIAHPVNFELTPYCGALFLANKAKLRIFATKGNMKVYNVNYVIGLL